ncbi:hypothetical protein [Vibrio gallaecicus]|uniref:hypothetical protein n=1 Tax=Vibrio gallaecicus TaxID=552386 RepID=UPI0025B2852B|nr:hypothetical protein [Vibrio gallaecicus]MDN3617498.1 hypothetical protein [Vibrio gallaecicus]
MQWFRLGGRRCSLLNAALVCKGRKVFVVKEPSLVSVLYTCSFYESCAIKSHRA